MSSLSKHIRYRRENQREKQSEKQRGPKKSGVDMGVVDVVGLFGLFCGDAFGRGWAFFQDPG